MEDDERIEPTTGKQTPVETPQTFGKGSFLMTEYVYFWTRSYDRPTPTLALVPESAFISEAPFVTIRLVGLSWLHHDKNMWSNREAGD